MTRRNWIKLGEEGEFTRQLDKHAGCQADHVGVTIIVFRKLAWESPTHPPGRSALSETCSKNAARQRESAI